MEEHVCQNELLSILPKVPNRIGLGIVGVTRLARKGVFVRVRVRVSSLLTILQPNEVYDQENIPFN